MITPFNIKIAIIIITSAYFLGSISISILLCKWFGLPDPRVQGSKNPGTTNVLRIGGKKLAASVLFLDTLKGFSIVWCAKLLFMPNLVIGLVAFAAFIGQLFPVFFGFRGGKGIAITLGIMLAMCWQLALLCLLVWIIVFSISKISSLAGISAVILAILISVMRILCNYNNIDLELLSLSPEFAICIMVLGGFILVKHKSNIINLFNKTEKQI